MICNLQIIILFAAQSNYLSVKDNMYVDIAASNPCLLMLNGTNQFGCTCKLYLNIPMYVYVFTLNINVYIYLFIASRFGNVGTLHFVTNSTDLNWLFNEGTADPYTVALTPKMFNR